MADIRNGSPVVAHVVVALCDNRYQGVVPVPPSLGNGQDPANNLYWGAMYGVKTFFRRDSSWTYLGKVENDNPAVLDKVVFRTGVKYRTGTPVEEIPATMYLVAEAWDGREMRAATDRFFSFAAGRSADTVSVQDGGDVRHLPAGGAAHMIAFVGHNGLMDFPIGGVPAPDSAAEARSAIVLACASEFYYAELLRLAGAHRLLLTKGLMAPEAYTLDAAIRAWASGGSAAKVREAAALAYDRYQRCGMRGARWLFTTPP